MIGILIVSHEPLGTALLRCTRHVFRRMPPQLAALDVIPDEDPNFAADAARELLKRINDGSGAVVLTDLFGATPARIAARLAEPGRVVAVAGVNLPMLMKSLGHRHQSLDDLIAVLVDPSQMGVCVLPFEHGQS